jgi:hypothetical protein
MRICPCFTSYVLVGGLWADAGTMWTFGGDRALWAKWYGPASMIAQVFERSLGFEDEPVLVLAV